MPDKIWYLKQIDLFSGIKDSEIMQIANRMIERKCRKKELLYSPFDDSYICFFSKNCCVFCSYGDKACPMKGK